GVIRLAVRFATDAEMKQLLEMAVFDLDPADPEFPKKYSKYNLEFHLFTAKLSQNPYLYTALENTMIKLKTVLIHTGKEHIEKDIQVHLKLAEAMSRRDAEEACRIEFEDLEKSIPSIF
ncbi:MAG: FCD domain-containing protein, partial [Mogibacterium sp.]|nr:FCD domain-containing protein [Mogibacterium sp.]